MDCFMFVQIVETVYWSHQMAAVGKSLHLRLLPHFLSYINVQQEKLTQVKAVMSFSNICCVITDIFPDKQLYIVFEFADCGTDLEGYTVCYYVR